MTAISPVAPHPSNNPLITSEAEHINLLVREVSAASIHILDVAYFVAQYAHDKSLTNWHTALSRLDILPAQIPPLDLNLNQIRDGICSIRGSFYLIPRGTLSDLEKRVSCCGQKHLMDFGGENPFKFRYFWDPARQQYGNTQSMKDQWIWMSDDLLEESRGESYAKQAQIVANLGANFEVPSLRDVAACLFFYKVATGEDILPQENKQNIAISNFTRVQESIQLSHLAIGSSGPSGVSVITPLEDCEEIGVVASWKS